MAWMDHTGGRGNRGRGRGHGAHGHRSIFGRRRGRARCRECTLDCLDAGEACEVAAIHDEHARIHALRFGMGEGSRVSCVSRIPAGPVILKSGRQEIAVGRRLAERIHVLRDEDPPEGFAS